MNILNYIYKGFKYFVRLLRKPQWIIVYIKFKLNKIQFHNDFKTGGIPILSISSRAKISIGKNFRMNNGLYHNIIGRQQACIFSVAENASLTIGNNVGISGTAFVCQVNITIEDNVRIGGGTVIYDTDFHSLHSEERTVIPEITEYVGKKAIIIKQNAFIGAHSTILKGVSIGRNAVIGACSVVTKSVPDNEIWAGNPAKFIRKME